MQTAESESKVITVQTAESESKVMEVGRMGFGHFRVINQNFLEGADGKLQ